MRKFVLLGVVLAYSLSAVAPSFVCSAPAPTAKADYQPLPKPGAKISLGTDHYFIFSFDKPLKIGIPIMRVEVFTRDGKRDTSFIVKGDADMPSMRGAHSTGDKDFSLSAKGIYLLPIRLVMPGDWEIRLTFVKNGKTTLRGVYLFDI